MKMHITKNTIALLDDNDILLEERNNEISSSRILIKNIEEANEFFSKLVKKHQRGFRFIRPAITLIVDEHIFEDEITQTEETVLFYVLFSAVARKIIYKGKNIKVTDNIGIQFDAAARLRHIDSEPLILSCQFIAL